jgi:phage gpG-like protein
MKIKIDVSGAQRKLRSVGKALDERQALTEIGDSVLKWTREGFATGGHGKWQRLAPNTVTIGTDDPVAKFHQFGSKAHAIRPRSQGSLRFMTVGGPRFAKSMHHPGNPARPMLPDEATAKGLAIDVVNKIVAQATGKD